MSSRQVAPHLVFSNHQVKVGLMSLAAINVLTSLIGVLTSFGLFRTHPVLTIGEYWFHFLYNYLILTSNVFHLMKLCPSSEDHSNRLFFFVVQRHLINFFDMCLVLYYFFVAYSFEYHKLLKSTEAPLLFGTLLVRSLFNSILIHYLQKHTIWTKERTL